MHEFEAGFARWVLNHRWLVILLSLVLVVAAASGARHLVFTNSYRIYFGPDHPHRVAFEKLETTYVKDDSVMIVLAPQDGQVFTRDFLHVVETMTERAWQLPYSNRVDSITNFQHTSAQDDDLIVADLVKNAASLSDQQLAKIKRIALAEPFLYRFLISEDARVTAINVNVQLPGLDETTEIPEIINFSRDIVAEFKEKHPEVDFHITGMAAMHNAFSEGAIKDITQLVPISFAVMLIVLAVLAGGIAGTVVTILVIAFSIVAALGLSGYLGFPITPTSAPSPNVILTVAVANSVHILVSYLHEMREGADKRAALEESLRINVHPVSLASITTAIGFLTMNFSPVPPFQQMGTTVAIGVLFSFILSITFLPALLSILPSAKVRKHPREGAGMRWLGAMVVARRRGLFWGMAALIIVLVGNVPRNELNDMFFQYFDETIEFRRATDFTLENLTGLYTINYSLRAHESGGISDPEFLRQAAAFVEWWHEQPETVHVSSLTDTMKRLNMNMHGDDREMYRLPDDRNLAAQYLLLYEMSLPYGLDLNNQINVDKSATRIVATINPITITEILALADRAETWLTEQAPAIRFDHGSGMVMMFSHIGRSSINAMMLSTTVALVLISMLLIFALRSVKIGLISLVPNLAPIGMGFGIWGIFYGQIGLGLSIVASMTLGIVVDDTVHFLSKYLRARREQGKSSEDSIRYAFNTVGRALLVTSVILIIGFLILSTSHFQMNAAMGLLVAIVISFAIMTVFLFLPPLLLRLDHDEVRAK